MTIEHNSNNAKTLDEKHFKEIFEMFYPPLCLYAKKFINSDVINKDIVQNVFIFVWENINYLSLDSSIKNYLFVSVKNRCLDYIRQENNKRKIISNQISLSELQVSVYDDMLTLNELQQLLKETLDKLPELHRRIFEMRRLNNMEYSEIAIALNISERTAKRYQASNKEFLKTELRDFLPLLLLFHVF